MIDVLKTLNLDEIPIMTKHTPARRIVKPRSLVDRIRTANIILYLYKT